MTVEIKDNIAEQIAARDIYNIHHVNDQVQDDRLLVPAQRRSLNNLISDIESFGESTARDMWLKLHALLGVNSINEITIPQYEKAESFLKTELEKATELAACKMLMSLILTDLKGKEETKRKTNRFSKEEFGTADFYKLNKNQLRQVLDYVKEISRQEQPVDKDLINQLSIIIKKQPKPTFIIFIAGFILGAVIF
ncbi:hypothetical protein RCS94_03600 [Orbaceae bacterium ac157xtp]